MQRACRFSKGLEVHNYGRHRSAVGNSSEVASWEGGSSTVLTCIFVNSFWDKGSVLPLTNDLFNTEFWQNLFVGGGGFRVAGRSERPVHCSSYLSENLNN